MTIMQSSGPIVSSRVGLRQETRSSAVFLSRPAPASLYVARGRSILAAAAARSLRARSRRPHVARDRRRRVDLVHEPAPGAAALRFYATRDFELPDAPRPRAGEALRRPRARALRQRTPGRSRRAAPGDPLAVYDVTRRSCAGRQPRRDRGREPDRDRRDALLARPRRVAAATRFTRTAGGGWTFRAEALTRRGEVPAGGVGKAAAVSVGLSADAEAERAGAEPRRAGATRG